MRRGWFAESSIGIDAADMTLSEGVTLFRKKVSGRVMVWINLIAGLLIISFGIMAWIAAAYYKLFSLMMLLFTNITVCADQDKDPFANLTNMHWS